MELEEVDEVEFMNEIQKYTVLYDSSQKKYKNKKTTKLNAWKRIAESFNSTPDLCETR